MNDRSARTVVAVAIAGTAVGAVAASSPVSAAPPPAPTTLACGADGSFEVIVRGGNALQVLNSTRNFVIMSASFVVDDTGETIVVQSPNGTQETRDILNCTFTTKRTFEVSGFFTPAT